eukprot:921258-Amphidinium_carterae.1
MSQYSYGAFRVGSSSLHSKGVSKCLKALLGSTPCHHMRYLISPDSLRVLTVSFGRRQLSDLI